MGQEPNKKHKNGKLTWRHNEHNLFLLTDVDHTYHHSDLNENAGKSTIDLTLVSGLSNLHIRTRAFDLIKAQHMAIEISVNDKSIWERILDTKLKNFQDSFPTNIYPDIIDAQTSALRNIIDSATDFFGNTYINI